jgi:S1-C subfamily serine protease
MSESSVGGTWRTLAAETATAIAKAGRSVVAVHARRRIPASGVHWRNGIIATANHAIEREEEIMVTLPDGRSAAAALAGRDPSTDIAILKLAGADLPEAEKGDVAGLQPGNIVLAAGRTAEGGTRASLALIGVVGPAWKTWRGGLLDCTLRLDRNLHPNLSGGPAVDDQGRVLGINTSALSRFAAVVIPASTVDRVTAELEKRGRIARGYLGVGMQPVRLPRKIREALKLASETGVMLMGIEPDSPAEKAGANLGDVLVALDGKPVCDIDDVQTFLSSERVGKVAKASILRGGALVELAIAIGERPAS